MCECVCVFRLGCQGLVRDSRGPLITFLAWPGLTWPTPLPIGTLGRQSVAVPMSLIAEPKASPNGKNRQSTMSISGAVKDRPRAALQGSRALIWELGSLGEPEPLGLMPSRTTARLIRFDVAQRH